MIGVAFSLEGTLAQTPGLARESFEKLCAELCLAGGREVSGARVAEARERFGVDAALSEGPAAGERIARAAHAAVDACPLTGAGIVTRFVQIAARLVPERIAPLPGVSHALAELESLAIPRAILTGGFDAVERSKAEALKFSGSVVSAQETGFDVREPAAFARLASELHLPAQRIWYASSDAGERDLASACGFNTVAGVEALLDAIKEPYTRSLLALRYVMRTALEWRAGHVINPEDLEP